jgi:glycine/D-amino acid oxidase-like deaminating enzyme
VVRATLQSIDQVIKPDAPDHSSSADLSVGTGPKPTRVDAAIVCLGLGARKLAGVDDANLYPIRGQTVILRAPWIRSGISLSGEEGAFSYVIPRGNGEVRARCFRDV